MFLLKRNSLRLKHKQTLGKAQGRAECVEALLAEPGIDARSDIVILCYTAVAAVTSSKMSAIMEAI